jgi:hypothetical protein
LTNTNNTHLNNMRVKLMGNIIYISNCNLLLIVTTYN